MGEPPFHSTFTIVVMLTSIRPHAATYYAGFIFVCSSFTLELLRTSLTPVSHFQINAIGLEPEKASLVLGGLGIAGLAACIFGCFICMEKRELAFLSMLIYSPWTRSDTRPRPVQSVESSS